MATFSLEIEDLFHYLSDLSSYPETDPNAPTEWVRTISRAGTTSSVESRLVTYKRNETRTGSISSDETQQKVKPGYFSRVGSQTSSESRQVTNKRTFTRATASLSNARHNGTFLRIISRSGTTTDTGDTVEFSTRRYFTRSGSMILSFVTGNPKARSFTRAGAQTDDMVSFLYPKGIGSATFNSLYSLLGAGATDVSVKIHIPYTARRFGVFVHNGWWPYERIAELRSASNVNYNDLRMKPGQATLKISAREPAATVDILQPGMILAIENPLYNSWAGPIVDLTLDHKAVDVEISALHWMALLDGRVTPQAEYYKAVNQSGAQLTEGSALVINNLLMFGNMRSHTGVYRPVHQIASPVLSDFQSGGQSILQTLEELHNRTNYEYWIELDITPSYIRAVLIWGTHQGYDTDIHLWNNKHFLEAKYTQDQSKVVSAAVVMGDFGKVLGERNAVTVVANPGAQRIDIGAIIQHANIIAAHNISSLPIGMRTERMVHEIMTRNRDELNRRSVRALERPLAQKENFDSIIGNTLNWKDFAVGNTFWRHDELFDQSIVRQIRMSGIQPDYERQEAQLQTELVLSK